MILTPIKRNNKLKLEIPIERTYVYHAASCNRIDIDKQKARELTTIFTEILKASHNNQTSIFAFTFKFKKTISQTLRFPYNARVYIMRASYDSIDNKLKPEICGKVNKDITFIQFFHSTPLHSTELFKIFFLLLILQLLFCQKLVGREKMASEYPQRVLVSQPIRTCLKVFVLRWPAFLTASM